MFITNIECFFHLLSQTWQLRVLPQIWQPRPQGLQIVALSVYEALKDASIKIEPGHEAVPLL